MVRRPGAPGDSGVPIPVYKGTRTRAHGTTVPPPRYQPKREDIKRVFCHCIVHLRLSIDIQLFVFSHYFKER